MADLKPIPTALAVLSVLLFGIALWMMRAGNFAMAGMSFLGVALVIYFRENRLKQEANVE
ncbi:MAG: hypothetical protein ABEH56_04625 [Salinirussus sp.]